MSADGQRARDIAADALKQTHTYGHSPFDTLNAAVDLLAGWVADELAKDTLDDWTLEYSKDRARARKMLRVRLDRMVARRQREKAALFDTVRRVL